MSTETDTLNGTKVEVLAPGQHVDDCGTYHEVSGVEFTDAAIAGIPLGVLYRRGGFAGTLGGRYGNLAFLRIKRDTMRLLLDRYVRIIKWKKLKPSSPRQEESHVKTPINPSPDHGSLLMASSETHRSIPDIDSITNYPVLLPYGTFSEPGINGRYFYDAPKELLGVVEEAQKRVQVAVAEHESWCDHIAKPTGLTPDEYAARKLAAGPSPTGHKGELCTHIRAVLDDLLIDFPFEDEASRQGVLGLLLTPLVRPAIDGNVPLHLVTSPIAGTGKTLIAEQLLGILITGSPIPALQLGKDEAEREKRITAAQLEGRTIWHFDNLNDVIDSPTIASFLTAKVFQGRMLGASQIVSLPNFSTTVASGNNVRATTEIGRRIVPIVLLPTIEHPEQRRNFKHPRLQEFLRESRIEILTCLVAAIDLWRICGSIPCRKPFGSFEAWRGVVGGVLQQIGYTEHMANAEAWREKSNDEHFDLVTLVENWYALHGHEPVKATALLEIATKHGLYARVFGHARSERSGVTTFSKSVLAKTVGQVVGQFRICSRPINGSESYWLMSITSS